MKYNGNNMIDVKRSNRSAVLRLLHEHSGMSRKRLAETTQLTPAAITKITAKLLEEGIISEGNSLESTSAGRREVIVEIDGRSLCALGIQINRRTAVLSAAWIDGTVIFVEELDKPECVDADKLCEDLSSKIMELADEKQVPRDKIIALGIAVRGVVSGDGQILIKSFDAINQSNYPLRKKMEALTGLHVVVVNNACALLLSHMFLDNNHDSLKTRFLIRCEDGIGASLSINDTIFHGSTGQCSEIGHVPVVRRGGKTCHCGKSGCLETIASPYAILDDANEILSEKNTPILWRTSQSKCGENITLEDVINAARGGDAMVAEIVDRAVSALSAALKSVIYIIDPDEIILYGILFDSQYYMAKLIAEMGEGVDSGHTTSIKKSPYNHSLDSICGCLIVFDDFIKNGGMEY